MIAGKTETFEKVNIFGVPQENFKFNLKHVDFKFETFTGTLHLFYAPQFIIDTTENFFKKLLKTAKCA